MMQNACITYTLRRDDIYIGTKMSESVLQLALCTFGTSLAYMCIVGAKTHFPSTELLHDIKQQFSQSLA
jgi:hypothetical protein